MSKTAKIFLISAMGANKDFIESCIASRYKLINRGRKYTVDNAYGVIQKERPDVIVIDHIIPLFSDSHDKLICDIRNVENYSPELVFTYCIPKEEEKNEWIQQMFEKVYCAGVNYVFNIRNLCDDEFRDKLRCIIENDGKGILMDIDEAILKKWKDELKEKWGGR